MANILPFSPVGASKVIAATTSTGSVALSALSGRERNVRVANSGSTKCFVEFGASAVEAVADTSMVLLAGATEVFAVPASVTHAAAIMDSSTADIHFTEGQGV